MNRRNFIFSITSLPLVLAVIPKLTFIKKEPEKLKTIPVSVQHDCGTVGQVWTCIDENGECVWVSAK